MKKIHEAHHNGAELCPGYAPFCKHIFVPNFVDARVGNMEITEENKSLIVSGYDKRRPEELAVLSRCTTVQENCLLQINHNCLQSPHENAKYL